MTAGRDPDWWRRAVVYQIYPRSFADSDGDGIGDLAGITSRLGYVSDLGVDAIWLSPFYRSPMADFGYDIADHTDVDPAFGTLADFDSMVDAAHALGLRVIVDWVPNHTSIQHPWFQASRSSRSDPKRSWYVWRDGSPDGGPPNNWLSQFPRVGPAWTFDTVTSQWYLHSYLPAQPDLDWTNPEVVAAMSDVLRFWLQRGVDGFRVDVPQRLGKDPSLTDNPVVANEPDPRFVGIRHDEDWPTVHDHLRAIRAVVDEHADRMLVGEVYVMNQPRMVEYVNGGDQLHLAHNFTFLRLPWDARRFRDTIDELERHLPPDSWASWGLGNHDHDRIASRFDHDGRGAERARLVTMLLLTLRGTPFIYQGDELGLPDSVVPASLRVDIHDRDRTRGPIPWLPPSIAGPGAGFSVATPWLPATDRAETINVDSQLVDPSSHLSLFRTLTGIRRGSDALSVGSMAVVATADDVLAFERSGRDGVWLVTLNFSTDAVPIGSTVPASARRRIVVSTDADRRVGPIAGTDLVLAPLEGLLIRYDDGRAL